MRAMQILEHGPSSSLKLASVAIPEPAEGQVLVAVKAAGVNPVDTYIRAGTNNYRANFPHIPGRDGSGVVFAVGANVQKLTEGQRVYFTGCLTGSAAEFTICDATQAHPLPDAVSFDEGACLGVPYTTAHHALFGRARAQEGNYVLVHGASGGVGLACVQLCAAKNMPVIGTAGSTEGLSLVRSQGATDALDHRSGDHLTGVENKFDVIIEMLANANLGHDLSCLRKGGTVAVVGSRGNVEINPRDLMSRDAAILGVGLANCSPADRAVIAEDIFPLLHAGILKPVVRKTYCLEELACAHDDVLLPGALGNLVVSIDQMMA